jgi:hypothetical protein
MTANATQLAASTISACAASPESEVAMMEEEEE